MAIVTPTVLPGEPGWEELQAAKAKEKEEKKKAKKSVSKVPTTVGKIELGSKSFRFGRAHSNAKGEKKLFIWRFKRKIAEVTIKGSGEDEEIDLKFMRLGGVANHKHLIQDADFQLKWMTREQELLMTQKECYLCKKKISKTAQPNLFHYNLFKKRTDLLEKAEKVPEEVVCGKLSVEEGWEKFNQTLEDGNRYYMSLEETALICATCAKSKGLR